MTDNKDQKKLQEKELSGLRKLAKRRWFYPALYLCAASLILTGVLLFQMHGSEQSSKNAQDRLVFNQDKPTSNPLSAGDEVFEWPAAQEDTQVIQPFYDVKGTQQEQQAALVNYNNSYVQNTGINIGANDDKSFTVTAAMSGKVVEAKKDDVLGYKVTLKHKNGVETLYQSLASVDVAMGQQIVQGEKIGTAGTEALNKPMGVHLHFEIRKNGFPVSPENYMNKSASEVKAVTVGAQSATANPSASEKLKNQESKETPKQDTSKSKDQSKSNTKGSESDSSKGSTIDKGSMD
ncbi:peptidoglycan DD-metalloendopeptidase family protein [Sporolactobacillus kofuensis]|uniref:Peptidoglycan DD-metalloendopeptidase family protein n=1 Tax=Sporolactobacillus kofuensis TaxID=269672 RepID=A0ABW1WHG0_9BACL|nr:M23 family metallopeptidase [Sporolactobacillus kofuensis]MCO7176329.1 M23 family metallopeptidase [Sporolactobacillus kofuensis]